MIEAMLTRDYMVVFLTKLKRIINKKSLKVT